MNYRRSCRCVDITSLFKMVRDAWKLLMLALLKRDISPVFKINVGLSVSNAVSP